MVETKLNTAPELKNPGIPLIDRYEVSGIEVVRLTKYKAMAGNGIIQRNALAHYSYCDNQGNIYTSIYINEQKDTSTCIDSFLVQADRFNPIMTYSCLKMHVRTDESRNLNCLTIEEVRDELEKVREYLIQKYGIVTDFSTAYFKLIELNITIPLTERNEKYDKALQLLVSRFPKNRKLTPSNYPDYYNEDSSNRNSISNKLVTGTFLFKNKQLDIEIYNKTRQLKNKGISVDNNLIRYEITIKAPRYIKKYLGTNEIYRLSMDSIYNYFEEHLMTFVIKPQNQYFKKIKANANKAIKEIYKPHSHSNDLSVINKFYKDCYEHNIPNFLDIDVLCDAINKKNIPDVKSKTIVSIRKRIKEKCLKEYPSAIGGIRYYKEVVSSLMGFFEGGELREE